MTGNAHLVLDWLMTDHGYPRERAKELVEERSSLINSYVRGGFKHREIADKLVALVCPPRKDVLP